MNQIELFKKIDELLILGIQNLNEKDTKFIITSNKEYFFAQASVEWITWLNENSFFDILNIEAEDKTRYSYRIPELDYLRRVVESNGDEGKVVEIMNSVDCEKNFNPEVVDQFLFIVQKLSVDNLVKIIPKIVKENWIPLMKNFNLSGFSYESLVKKLVEAKQYESLILLAKAMLVVNKDTPETNYSDQYFYMTDIHDSGIFKALKELKNEYAAKTIEMIVEILQNLVSQEKPAKENEFIGSDLVYLMDMDFFNLKSEDKSGLRYKEDIQSLFKTFIKLIEIAISGSCDKNARRIFDSFIKKLPDSQNMWRIKIFAMAQCPKVFDKELKEELNRPFKGEVFADFLAYSEYYHALKGIFADWANSEQRDYVKEVFNYFSKKIADNPDKPWIKKYGWEISSSITENLTLSEKEECEKHFGSKPDAEFKPKPMVGDMRSGFVADQSPVDFTEEGYTDIKKIIKDLKGPLSPEKLKEKYKGDDFLRPRNAEGLGNELKEDMKLRISDYLAHASDFLDSEINIHYTYSFLQGIEEYLKENKNNLSQKEWDYLFDLFNKIKGYEKKSVQENDKEDRWFARWTWVEKTIASILKLITTKNYEDLFAERRNDIFDLITSLLKSEDPTPEQEKADYGGDLYTVAINSTRGIAFEALVNFIYLDGETLKNDIAKFYHQYILPNASLSIRFLIGRYLASFYFRDKHNFKNYYNEIFQTDDENCEKFLAAWEGYLSNSLYQELFEDLEEYYKYAIGIKSSEYSERRRFKDMDEGIGVHLALAFAHFDNVKYTEKEKHPLLKILFSGDDLAKQKEFISFLGRGMISQGKDWLAEKKVNLNKLKDLWKLLLNKSLDIEVYSAFGFWVNDQKDVFADDKWLAKMMAETLTKSNGEINWDHGLHTKLPVFANANPDKTLIILKKYLIDGLLGPSQGKWFHLDDKKFKAFEILYEKNPKETKDLINKLLEKGGRKFWPLLKIVEDK